MTRSTRTSFVIGLVAGAAVAAGLNLLPYLWTYRAYGGDGYEVIGFPLIFRRLGGYVFVYEFRAGALVVDMAIAGALALTAGWAAMKLLPLLTYRSRRGFPVRLESSADRPSTKDTHH